MNNFNFVILFLLIASTLQPLLQARYEAMRRARQIAAIESKRGSRVITMIHREETRRFFSLPVSRMIDLEDAQKIIPAIKETPADNPDRSHSAHAWRHGPGRDADRPRD